MTDNLAARVLAAIEETERIAEDATGTRWVADVTAAVHVDPAFIRDNTIAYGRLGYVAGSDPGPQGDAFRKHITHHDPQAILRRCDADREILDLHNEPVQGFSRQQCATCVGCWATEEGEGLAMCHAPRAGQGVRRHHRGDRP